jgi:hypothetical protein
VLAVLVPWTGARLDARRADTTQPDELVYLPDATRLRPLALGYDNVLGVYWIQSLGTVGVSAISRPPTNARPA